MRLLPPQLLEKNCVVVMKQCSCKLGRCPAAATLVPLMQRRFWLILWDKSVQVAGRFVGENHGRHGKNRRPIDLSISVFIVANFEVASML